MTVISRTATELVTDVHVLHYLWKGEDRQSWHDSDAEAQEQAAKLETYGADWQARHVTVERMTYRVGDRVEASAFGRMRQGVVVGIGRTLVKLELIRNREGGTHTGTYQPRYVTNLDRPAEDVTPAPELTVTPEAQAAVEAIAAELPTAAQPTRLVRLVGPDSTDSCDLYVDRHLAIAALTRPERAALLAALQAADAPAPFPYDVQELRGLDLPHAMAMVHNAQVHHLALWHDGAPMAEWELDPRAGADEVRERAEELAAQVTRRVNDGLL